MAKKKGSKKKSRRGCGIWILIIVGIIFVSLTNGGQRDESNTSQRLTSANAQQTQSSRSSPTRTPSATRTPTITPSPTSSNTLDPSITPTVTETPTVTFTFTSTFTATATFTPSLTRTARPSSTPRPPTAGPTTTRYASSNGNLRSCARIDNTACPVSGTVVYGEELAVIGQETGDEFAESTVWYAVRDGGKTLYIHSSLTSSSPLPTSAPQLISTAPPSAGVTCPGFQYNCPELTCEQAYACLAAGKDSLDRDNDGVPCEQQCEGG